MDVYRRRGLRTLTSSKRPSRAHQRKPVRAVPSCQVSRRYCGIPLVRHASVACLRPGHSHCESSQSSVRLQDPPCGRLIIALILCRAMYSRVFWLSSETNLSTLHLHTPQKERQQQPHIRMGVERRRGKCCCLRKGSLQVRPSISTNVGGMGLNLNSKNVQKISSECTFP